MVYIPMERKCPVFRGKTGISMSDWLERCNLACVDAICVIFRKLTSYMITWKVKPGMRSNIYPGQITRTLRKLSLCSKSCMIVIHILHFYYKKQQEGKMLQEFFCLMEKVVRHVPDAMPNTKRLLRDQFVEHDCALCRELKQFVQCYPVNTLLDERREAISWEKEGRPGDEEPELLHSFCLWVAVWASGSIFR